MKRLTKLSLKTLGLFFLLVSALGCLKTRSQVGEDEQSQIYSRKNADNQAAQKESARSDQHSEKVAAATPVDERDELIRTLNGRVESLESQISALNKEKSSAGDQSAQKAQLLEEALKKMEAQIQKLEAEQAQQKMASPPPSSDANALKNGKKAAGGSAKEANSYEVAQGLFAGKEWKKAILNYQKYVEDNPKGKEVPDAKYKIGVCFQELGMKEEAVAFYEEVIANYSKSDAGKKAKIRLTKLKPKK